jgi:membrane peptidoglycan carboxypeptidase
MEMPEVIEPSSVNPWHDGPQGPIVRQVETELEEVFGITDVRTGGYRITTTIDPDIQEAALNAARRDHGGPLWENQNDNIDAALVAIDPKTGAVLAYYGGDDGTGWDLAGKNRHPETGEWYTGRPPGSSFKIYTLIAALQERVSFDTHWKTSEFAPDYRPNNPIRNAGRVAQSCEGEAPDYCTLRWSTVHSYNVPFAYFSLAMGMRGPQAIVDAAKASGITMMTGRVDGERVVVDLTEIGSASEVEPLPFFHEVAFGQYAVTVLDHASGTATLAAQGVYHRPHFVEKVEQRNRDSGEWETVAGDQIAGEERVSSAIANSITQVLTAVPGAGGNALANGRPAAAKTGTWEHDQSGVADAWMTGYTPQIAATVWVGDGEDNDPITDPWGTPIASSGLPSQIWKQFMDEAHAVKDLPHEQFPPGPDIGDPQHQYANGELPEEDEERCRPRFLCRDDDDDDDDDD